MKNKAFVILTVWFSGFCLALALSLAPGRPRASDGSSTQKNLARKYDIINIKGEFLPPYNGAPIEQLALLAYHNGSLSPVPFQVDERDRKGRYVMTHGKTAGHDEDNGALDGNDELIFCATDTGDRLPAGERATRIEIEVTDPRYPDRHGWVYLAWYKSDKPPRSSVDYVDYDPRSERIISKNYILGYRKGYMFYNDLIYPVGAGGNGRDFFDRIKFRTRIEFLGGKVALVRNEDAIKAEVQGWIDGPVRVVQSTINYIKIFDMLPSVSFNSLSEYYPYIQTSPITVRFPFELGTVVKTLGIKSMIADVYGDMPGMVGAIGYTNLSPTGYVYTGHAQQSVLDKMPKLGLVWGFATKKGVGTWFPRLIFPDTMYQFNSFYISDNESLQNPPDDVPGEIGAGVRLDIRKFPPMVLQMMSKESFMLKFETYFAPPGLTPESAAEWLDIQDYPLLWDVNVGGSVENAGHACKIRTAPPWNTGQDGVITDARNRKIALKGIAFFIGGPEVDPRQYYPGENVANGSFHLCKLANLKSITNHIVEFDPYTKTKMAMFSKVTMTNGSTMDMMTCRACGWAGVDEEGRVMYLSSAQIQRIDFNRP